MSEPAPELRWAPLEPKPKRRGRIWAIVGLAIAALAVIGVLLFFLLPRGDAGLPSTSGTSGPDSPTQTPEVTPPTPVDPTMDVFREKVEGWLTDAPLGLDIVADAPSDEAVPVVDTLEQDARRLSDARPPSAIEEQWREGVNAYSQRLAELQSAIAAGPDTADAVEAAREAAQNLRSIVGL